MNKKKNRDANLEQLRVPLLFLGLLFACGVVLSAFEWRTYEKAEDPVKNDVTTNELPDEVIFTAVAMKKPLPPPPAPKPVVDVMKIVADDKKIGLALSVPSLEPEDPEPYVEAIPSKKEVVTEEVIDLPDIWPSFPGGDTALMKYLSANIEYPKKAKYTRTQGIVYIEFIVGRDGEIEDAKVLRGIGLGCDEEALRVVDQMPKWIPGKQKGHPVKVRFRLPVKYVLKE